MGMKAIRRLEVKLWVGWLLLESSHKPGPYLFACNYVCCSTCITGYPLECIGVNGY